ASEKSQALETFKKFKALVEKEAGTEIKCLRTDRGGEFNSREFKLFCEDKGIQRQLTASYTPHQNGVAERKNRTVMNMVRSVMSARKVPKIFWPEATNWCVHVLNRSPTSALENSTPEERWSNRKPSVSYFRVFGCIAHVHVPKERRLKLDDRSFKCVLFGVSEEAKAYRLYDPTTKRIIVSKDVVFEEEVSWNWSQESEINPSDLEWEDNVEQKDDEVGAGSSEIANEPLNDSTGPNNSAGSSSGNESRPSSVNPVRATTNERERRQTRAPTWKGFFVMKIKE
ncbi:retrovirus-related pol polyprotein from transposon TNT 1-94, partial [Tanacetum coccineum]